MKRFQNTHTTASRFILSGLITLAIANSAYAQDGWDWNYRQPPQQVNKKYKFGNTVLYQTTTKPDGAGKPDSLDLLDPSKCYTTPGPGPLQTEICKYPVQMPPGKAKPSKNYGQQFGPYQKKQNSGVSNQSSWSDFDGAYNAPKKDDFLPSSDTYIKFDEKTPKSKLGPYPQTTPSSPLLDEVRKDYQQKISTPKIKPLSQREPGAQSQTAALKY